MSRPWSVRRLGEEDWQLHRAVRLAMLLDTPGAYGSSFGREVDFTETTWRERTRQPVFLAEREDGLPLGTATLPGPEPGSDPEIVAMWVAPHARGTGIADALVISCRDHAVAQGAGTVRLHVMLDNLRAVACYNRAGFASDGTCGDVPGCSRMVAHAHEIAPER